jgi:hypothetical protein
VLFAFDDARAGNEKETAAADADIADLEFSFQFASSQRHLTTKDTKFH